MRERFERLDLNLLRVLVALDRCRSVTEAGKLLSLSQPATSNALARLRDAFDDPLYVRAANGLAPTPLAERLGPVAARQLEALEQALTTASDFDPQRSSTEWRLSLSDLGEIVFLSRIAAAVLGRAPNTRLSNAAVPAGRIADALARREVDLALGILAPLQRGLRSVVLFRETYAALGGPGSQPAWHTRAGLSRASLVVASPTATFHQGIEQSLVRHKLGDRISIRARHYAAIPDLVQAAPVVAIVPETFARMVCERQPLQMWPVPLKLPQFEIRLVWHECTERDAAQTWLRRQVLALFGAAVPSAGEGGAG